MTRVSVVGVASLALLGTLSTAPGADADPRVHGNSPGGRFGGGRSFHAHGQSFRQRGPSFHKDGFGRHRFFPRHFSTFGVVVAPPVVVYSPFVFDPSPPYYSPPPYSGAPPPYAPPVMYSPPPVTQPPPPPPPRVVEYPTGRYELRGDGIQTPYTWVWIPNPPPAPPAPPNAPPLGAPMSGDAPPTRHTQVYRWVDEQGVLHLTDRLEAVPRRYREEATRSEPS